MAAFAFQPARRERISLLIGLSGGTGSGKTYSAMRLATGLAGGKQFCGIDTESGRMKFYADSFTFDHGDLKPPFTPMAYIDAIAAADHAGYPVIVVDSASHEWAGEGGVLDLQEAELDRMAGTDWQKREACKMASWIRPKSQHKAFVMRLLQIRAHIILCCRAEPKIEMAREGNKTIVREKQGPTGLEGWFPICEKNLPFELTLSFLLLATAPGVPHPIKLPQPHQPFFPAGQPITEAAGVALAEWAGGCATSTPAKSSPVDASLVDEYVTYVNEVVLDASDAPTLGTWWNSTEQKDQRRRLGLMTGPTLDHLKQLVKGRLEELKGAAI